MLCLFTILHGGNLNCYGSPIEIHDQLQLGEVASTANVFSASTIVDNIQPQRTQVCLDLMFC
jgi:hypothetical protein